MRLKFYIWTASAQQPALQPPHRHSPLRFCRVSVLGPTCEWARAKFVILCLAYCTKHNALQVHDAVTGDVSSFFFWGWIVPHCSIHHVFFIHSSVDTHVSCFCILNKRAMTTGVQVSLLHNAITPFGYTPRSGNAQSHGNPIFNFFEELFSIKSIQIYIPTVCKDPSFSISFPSLAIFYHFDNSQSNR